MSRRYVLRGILRVLDHGEGESKTMRDEVFHDATLRDATQALHAQIAQRLFGWRYDAAAYMYVDRAGDWYAPSTLPAYTSDPAATAQVWQWLEQQAGDTVESITFEYYHAACTMVCLITCTKYREPLEGPGATWPEALCRAALALAEALEQEKR